MMSHSAQVILAISITGTLCLTAWVGRAIGRAVYHTQSANRIDPDRLGSCRFRSAGFASLALCGQRDKARDLLQVRWMSLQRIEAIG
jgi:hypothetical protein